MSDYMYGLVREHSKKYSQIAIYKDDFIRAWLSNSKDMSRLFEIFFNNFKASMLENTTDLPLAISMCNYGITQMSAICLSKGLSDVWLRAVLLKDYYDLEHSKDIEEMLEHLETIALRIIDLSKPEHIPLPTSDTVNDCLNFIDKNIASPLSMAQISEALNYSSEHIARKFKDEMKYGINEYIAFKKIEQAKILLLKNHSINEVAEKLSFSSNGYFIKVFRKETGLTPKKYQLWLANKLNNK